MHKYMDDIITFTILVMLFVLMITGIDGEVKTAFALCIGIIVRGIWERAKGGGK